MYHTYRAALDTGIFWLLRLNDKYTSLRHLQNIVFIRKDKPQTDQNAFKRQTGFSDKAEECAPLAPVEYTQHISSSEFFLKF